MLSCARFRADGADIKAGKRGFGSDALTIDGRIFAMLTRECFVVKLPRTRVDELVASGWGERFDANRGVSMKEWLVVDAAYDKDWNDFAREAWHFVQQTPIAS